MQVSEARLTANRLNALRSNGPSAEGREISRRNAVKHGLSGAGVVLPEGDRAEVDRRVEAFTLDMKPRSPAGAALVRQMATLSVRAERAAEQESAAIAMHVRHATDAFDEERIERANQLFEALADDPRDKLRKLRKRPEGVERLIDEWSDLRADLTTDPEPDWTAEHLERAANLAGLKARHARASRLGALSRGVRGDFASLADSEGEGLALEGRRGWAKAALVDLIDAEIAALEEHYETLDFETIERDRAEAGARALFDPSKPATLARRYEGELRRGFFKALQEFRQLEAESEARAGSSPTLPNAPGPDARMGSSREMPTTPAREPDRGAPDTPMPEFPTARGPESQPSRSIRPDQRPG